HHVLILMDIQLPSISGIEALHRLRADPVTRPTPIVAITASVMTQDQKRIMAAGFDGFHGKPISVKQLLATVREILDKSLSSSLCHARQWDPLRAHMESAGHQKCAAAMYRDLRS